jgi:hypothetical protein
MRLRPPTPATISDRGRTAAFPILFSGGGRSSLSYNGGVFRMDKKEEGKRCFQIENLEERIAPSNANFPPGQFPSGNPAHAPGQSNPNEVPATNPGNDK